MQVGHRRPELQAIVAKAFREFGVPFITYLIKPWAEERFPEHWTIIIGLVGVALLLPVYSILYVVNLVLIRFAGKSDFGPRLIKRWRDILQSPNAPSVLLDDYVDKVADLQLRISMPMLVRGIVTDLAAEHTTASTSLQRTIDHYADRNELRAFISVLGNQWKTPTEFTYPISASA